MSQQVSLSTDRVHLSWRGACTDGEDVLVVRSIRGDSVEVRTDVPLASFGLVEETTYTLWAESLGGEQVEVRHADPVVTAALRTEMETRL